MPRRATSDRRRRYSQRLHSLAERARGDERGRIPPAWDPAEVVTLTNPSEVAEFLAAFRPEDSQKGQSR
jgi:hypothetical protein